MQNNRLNIIMFGHKRIPSREGGVEVVVEKLSTRMAQLGHHVTCYNRDENASDAGKTYKGVAVRTVWTLKKKGLAAVTSSFFAAVCSIFTKADIVHIHAEGPAFMCWLPKLFGKRVIVTVHGLDWQREKWQNSFGKKYIYAGEKMAVRFADEIIVLSRNMQDYFLHTYGRKTHWIPNGVDRQVPLPANEIEKRFGLKKDSYILFLGRLVPEKGIHYLIEAFQNVRTDKKLVIAGHASDTEVYTQQLHKLSETDPRIIFTGFVQGNILAELYSNSYVYVLPSDVEGMPLTLLEAMSYGNCCLTSDIKECTEVTAEHALSFQKGNVDDLRQVLQMLCCDELLVYFYKSNAADYICEKNSWDRVIQETHALYSETHSVREQVQA